MPTMPTIHPVVKAYVVRHGLGEDALREDGRLALEFDDRYRVQVRPASEGRVALVSRLADLTRWSRLAGDDLLQRLAHRSAGLARTHAAGLVIDEALNSLQLQQVLPAATGVDALERELAEFVNVLAFWSRTCNEEAGRRNG